MKDFWEILLSSFKIAFFGAYIGVGFIVPYAFYKVFCYFDISESTSAIVTAVICTALVVGFGGVSCIANKQIVKEDLDNRELSVKKQKEELDRKTQELDWKMEEFSNYKQATINNYKRLLAEDAQTYPWMAQQFSDFKYLHDIEVANGMAVKSRPALSSAKKVSLIAKEKRELQKQLKMYEYQLHFLENMFPWLPSFEQLNVKEAIDCMHNTESEYDRVRNYLSPSEYKKLSNSEKYQLALERWRKRKKTDWEAGRDYERYIGYVYENAGFKVEYVGALHGLEDRGIDLIASKGKKVEVVQCKRYSAKMSKVVRENTVAQIYGVTALFNMENPNKHAEAVIITSSSLSAEAKHFAEYLGVKVYENMPLPDDYPIIKCNINKDGEKIYHLPFDQQYDKINIAGKKGAIYIGSVPEAEKLGFRRAKKWMPETNKNS